MTGNLELGIDFHTLKPTLLGDSRYALIGVVMPA